MKLRRPTDMPLDWHALMNDEKVLRMNNEQLGMYLRLLYRAWFADEPASLPADDSTLASITQASASVWAANKSAVLAPFRLRGGRYYQKKMLEVYQAVLRKLERYSINGKTGAQIRWSDNELNSQAIAKLKQSDSNLNLNRIEGKKSDKASRPPPDHPNAKKGIQPPRQSDKGNKLLKADKERADLAEELLGDQWTNDAGKWIGRILSNPQKFDRVFAEVKSAMVEARIKTTPAQYSEQIWKEFA